MNIPVSCVSSVITSGEPSGEFPWRYAWIPTSFHHFLPGLRRDIRSLGKEAMDDPCTSSYFAVYNWGSSTWRRAI